MKYGMDSMLSKYNAMATAKPAPLPSSQPSSIWTEFIEDVTEKLLPVRGSVSAATPFDDMMRSIQARATLFEAPGGAPYKRPEEEYMQACVVAQYKRAAVATGVYGVACAEGAQSGQAELSRVAALAARFRAGQRPSAQKFGDWFESRKQAVSSAHQCTYEERLFLKYGGVAATSVRASAEARRVCIRYAGSAAASPAERYMVSCVDKQLKMRAVPNGVYGTQCDDGSVSGMAEYKRVAALGVEFRVKQMGKLEREQWRFDARKEGRDVYAHMCSYEEGLFNKYPAVGAAMRGPDVRY